MPAGESGLPWMRKLSADLPEHRREQDALNAGRGVGIALDAEVVVHVEVDEDLRHSSFDRFQVARHLHLDPAGRTGGDAEPGFLAAVAELVVVGQHDGGVLHHQPQLCVRPWRHVRHSDLRHHAVSERHEVDLQRVVCVVEEIRNAVAVVGVHLFTAPDQIHASQLDRRGLDVVGGLVGQEHTNGRGFVHGHGVATAQR